jgi:hypothetical protein
MKINEWQIDSEGIENMLIHDWSLWCFFFLKGTKKKNPTFPLHWEQILGHNLLWCYETAAPNYNNCPSAPAPMLPSEFSGRK